jgi:hypothetical protein
MQKTPLSLKAMIAALTAAIPAAPMQASIVPSPKVAPSVFARSVAAAKAGTYSKGHFLLKDVASIGPAGAASANSATAAKSTKAPKSSKKPGYAKVRTANGVKTSV